MRKDEFLVGVKYLSEAFSKDFTKEEITIWYDFMRFYTPKVFQSAIKKVVGTNKFIPKIAEMIDYCEEEKAKHNYIILEIMKNDGYFKKGISELTDSKEMQNYDKAICWLQKGSVPKWFDDDMREYENRQIENKNNKLIGGK
jgi:hypothetical protein